MPDLTSQDSCMICSPGYYSQIFAVEIPETDDTSTLRMLRNCKMQAEEIKKDFFVQPEVRKFFIDGHEDDLYSQLTESGRGERLEDPFYYL